jgi:hypothetical protein
MQYPWCQHENPTTQPRRSSAWSGTCVHATMAQITSRRRSTVDVSRRPRRHQAWRLSRDSAGSALEAVSDIHVGQVDGAFNRDRSGGGGRSREHGEEDVAALGEVVGRHWMSIASTL